MFSTTYQRVVYYTADKPELLRRRRQGLLGWARSIPYVIHKDYYGQRVLPENLGNIEYDIRTIDPTSNFNYTADDIITNAKYAMAVRDGFASFFFHPFWLEPELGVPGLADFQKTVDGITAAGLHLGRPQQAPVSRAMNSTTRCTMKIARVLPAAALAALCLLPGWGGRSSPRSPRCAPCNSRHPRTCRRRRRCSVRSIRAAGGVARGRPGQRRRLGAAHRDLRGPGLHRAGGAGLSGHGQGDLPARCRPASTCRAPRCS